MSSEGVIALGRELAALGYCPGGAGNVSWRDGDEVLISRSGVDLFEMDASDLVRCQVDWETRRIVGTIGKASKEVPLHLAMHARNPDTSGFVGHVHSTQGIAVSCVPAYSAESSIPALTPYFVMKVGNVPLIDYAHPGSWEQADEVFEAERNVTTLLLQNHGFISWGGTFDRVVDRIRESELTAEIWLQVRGLTDVNMLTVEEQNELQRRYGS